MQLGGDFSEKCGKKGVSAGTSGHFSARTVVYKLARQIISGMGTAEKRE